jgi:hypothetical protein
VKGAPKGKGDGVNSWMGVCLALLMPVMAQQILDLSVPPKPEDHLLDQARLFVVDDGRREAMSAALSEFSERTGYDVQVAFFDNLIGVDLPEQTDVLKDAWFHDGPGLILVVVTDSGEWQIGWASTPQVMTESGSKVPVLDKRDVAPQEQIRVVQALGGLPPMAPGSVEGAEELVKTLLANLELSFQEVERPPGQRMRVWVLAIGLMAALLLVAVLTVTWIRRSDARARDQLLFPDVPVGRRLGAPHGGGKISVVDFSQDRADGV